MRILLMGGLMFAGMALADEPAKEKKEPSYAALEFRDSPKEWDQALHIC